MGRASRARSQLIMKTTTTHILTAALLSVPCIAQKPLDEQAPLSGQQQQSRARPVEAKLVTGAPNDWFDKTRFNLGDHLDKDTVKGTYNWKNPRKETVQWRDFAGSCQCVKVVITVGEKTYELVRKPQPNTLNRLDKGKDGKIKRVQVKHINVPGGESGTLVVHMEMHGLQGSKIATLDFSTTDEMYPRMHLEWQATGIKYFSINPPEVFFNDMGWDDKRKFSFKVSSAVHPDFKLLDHDPLPDYVKLTKKEQIEIGGRKMWVVEGTLGPKVDPGAGGARIVFKTDKGKNVDLGVVASVQRPIEISPGTFFSFGRVSRKSGKEFELRITPNDKFDLQMEKVEFLKATVDKKFLACESSKDGKALVLKVKLKPGAKGAYILKGSMAVSLNHPSMKRQVFDFNGILR